MAKRGEEEGVLLYYKYAVVPDVFDLAHFFESNCESLGLLGRVRVAPEGVNVTIGGKMSSLEKHISAVKSNHAFDGTDFKLASCHCSSDLKVAEECGFTSLSVRVVKELVTFSPNPLLKSPAIADAGNHLSAAQFHSVLENAGDSVACNGLNGDKKLILLDARNVYETRIGRFQAPDVETLHPEIRQYSDLPAWIDNHSEQLRGNSVFMYCTGGIRCEMASAYIKSKGAGYENVFQLFGGIQRYLEQYPDGGFFKGKNFVFDHRIAVGSADTEIVGSCLLCGASFDDYSSRCRCMHCRMLVLVCYSCQQKSDSMYVCELCKKHGKSTGAPTGDSGRFDWDTKLNESTVNVSVSERITSWPQLPSRQGSILPRKLRILCLHGFRQNASGFKGRTASLAKKLRSLANFVFVDAPHVLPFVYQPDGTKPGFSSRDHPSAGITDIPTSTSSHCPPMEMVKKKFAWLVGPNSGSSEGTNWKMADEPFDPQQYQHQTEGFVESYKYLKAVFCGQGPFDGVMGFSQGAAMAAMLCARREKGDTPLDFRFVILCSGFALSSMQVSRGSINYPSLHIFGNNKGRDRQISQRESIELSRFFHESTSVVIEHEMGHIIPTQPPYIDQIKAFLQGFL